MSITTLDIGYDESRGLSSGCDCRFMQVGELGLKIYNNAEIRDRSYYNQKWLSERGLAPAVGEVCEVKYADSDIVDYAFYTECAECYGGNDDVNRALNLVYGIENYGDDNYTDEEIAEYDDFKRYSAGVESVESDLYELGIGWLDTHEGNIGFTSDGRAVLIDCADRLGLDKFDDWGE